MRRAFTMPRFLAAGLAATAMVAGLSATPTFAAPGSTAGAKPGGGSPHATRALPPVGATADVTGRMDVQGNPLDAAHRRPLTLAASHTEPNALAKPAAAASCTPADFGSRSGAALVAFVQASTTDCVNTLFGVTGTDAYNVFREAQMVTMANAYQNAATTYPGDNSTGVWQLELFLRAGYYVQYGNAAAVGSYGPTLATGVEGALDTFVASPHFMDVSAAHGDVLGDAIIMMDSANEQARYLDTYKRVLNGYTSSYDAFASMDAAVNDVYTPLFRGHQNPAFVSAVTADPSILATLNSFALNHLALLGGANAYLDSNAGRELARFLQYSALQPTVRPQLKSLLGASSISGPTAALWVGVADMTNSYDQAQCSYYDTCNLVPRLTAAALPIKFVCDAGHTFVAQAMTDAELAAACTSVQGQDKYFHGIVKDNGPVANDYNTNIAITVFASRNDYQIYSGLIFGNSTDNGGEYLEGNPADPNNQARFVAYQNSYDNGFPARIWNLNHEYTHYLDGRYDTYGDFNAAIAVPDIWWIEGFAEYVSYSYRGVDDTRAIPEAAQHTYPLSTLWQTTYDNTTTDRTYQWGYLAVRYMIENHPADVQNMLAKFRTGDYTGGYAVYNSGIGTRYDADFNTWLDACAAGACAGHGQAGQPTAAFDAAVTGLTVNLTDRSTESGTGHLTAWAWTFGDGTTSSAASPSKTYAVAGSYPVTLTVTDDGGKTSTVTRTVTVSSGGVVACTDPDPRVMGQNCSRDGQSATKGNLDYLYLYLPAGTTTLKITTSGGSGNAWLYYNTDTWASKAAYTARSTSGGTTQRITVTNATAGYRYISLYANSTFSGVTVTTQY